MTPDLRFRTFRPWLADRFEGRVHRVALDAGSTCPNRDGSKAFGGCVYCNVEGSGTGALATGNDLKAQLEAGIRRVTKRSPDCGVIAYFQSYSNTYVERERFREVLDSVRPYLGAPIVCVSVATRPDTLPDWAIEELAALRSSVTSTGRQVDVWVELGLESANDQVLCDIRRFHTVADFNDAVTRCHAADLEVIGHAILGLPNDGREGARATAKALASSGVIGVKVHNLMVLRRTQLEKDWRAGQLEVLDIPTYVQWLADFIELLDPAQVLHRLTGDAPEEELLAPDRALNFNIVRQELTRELMKRGTRQGAAFSTSI
ncbi:MAG: radical SAM protein (TIGR01212 family) [Planctomycetota bacterium]|jgi:radical SAM protein (TIGR01212 family)